MTLQLRLMAAGLGTQRAQTRAEVEQAPGSGMQAAILSSSLPGGELQALRRSAATEDLPVYLLVDREDSAVVTTALEVGRMTCW